MGEFNTSLLWFCYGLFRIMVWMAGFSAVTNWAQLCETALLLLSCWPFFINLHPWLHFAMIFSGFSAYNYAPVSSMSAYCIVVQSIFMFYICSMSIFWRQLLCLCCWILWSKSIPYTIFYRSSVIFITFFNKFDYRYFSKSNNCYNLNQNNCLFIFLFNWKL